ncbi:hypothetical protein MKZ38_003417 [Zalerion maritima]|uniref:Uncharacterized protein n=1 Tax=Zalerion maritima TaxID=339359 RepID=A0AAD5RUG8_9PEZI|nr:hypothetical protein MKZ38_003417 [Zalerion maritima]
MSRSGAVVQHHSRNGYPVCLFSVLQSEILKALVNTFQPTSHWQLLYTANGWQPYWTVVQNPIREWNPSQFADTSQLGEWVRDIIQSSRMAQWMAKSPL